MAVDDVRRAQVNLIEAHERLGGPASAEKYRAVGDFLYHFRLLYSHLHEAARALRSLDTAGAARIDALLEDNKVARDALQALRVEFNDEEYRRSLVARLRNGIGFHYRSEVIREQVVAELDEESILESTAAQMGGLARVADPFVKMIMDGLVGGDFMADEVAAREVAKGLETTGHLLIFVDHLFDKLVRDSPDALIDVQMHVVDVPLALQQAHAAVEADRAAERAAGG